MMVGKIHKDLSFDLDPATAFYIKMVPYLEFAGWFDTSTVVVLIDWPSLGFQLRCNDGR
jgi:hypothetical protein